LWVRVPPNPDWISQTRFSRETAPEAAERPIERCKNKGGMVSANEVKKDKTAMKTLKNSNKQQQTWMRGSQVVQSSKMLSGLGCGKIVGKGKRLPPIL
jgi:hypothetical protein